MSDKKQTAKPEGFEIVDRPPEAEDDKSIRETDILQSLLSGKAVQKTLKTSRGEFIAIYPLGRERLKMDRIRALRRHGIPADAFDEFANYNNNVWSTLDVVIVDGPDWYKRVKKNNPSWSWEEGPDEELTVELFELVRSFRDEVTEAIRQSDIGKDVGTGKPSTDESTMGDGAFSGLANRPEAAGSNG
jgi:hypothetical protein